MYKICLISKQIKHKTELFIPEEIIKKTSNSVLAKHVFICVLNAPSLNKIGFINTFEPWLPTLSLHSSWSGFLRCLAVTANIGTTKRK